ncbi:MAG: CpsD/CapB family tyrosine-protein kinase [Clostridia bacterium]|nr:CpsD/CapB family tyrosine-protein kinase [Clostridia bacterium]
MKKRNNKNNSRREGHSPNVLLNENTPFAIVEAYKTLRSNVTFSIAAIDQNVPHRNAMVVTSSVPNEGKSVNSANLALSFGQTGGRVLLIDADMRKPTQHLMFEQDNSESGLSTILLKLNTLASTIRHNVRPGLDLITSGPIPPNPSELLGSQTMIKFLDIVCRVYDYVIVDTPPVTVVTDALTFSHNTAGIILNIRQDYCLHKDLSHAISSIKLSDTNILGTMIADTSSGGGGSGYRYRYRYNYGYYRYRRSSKYGYNSYYSNYGNNNKGTKDQ